MQNIFNDAKIQKFYWAFLCKNKTLYYYFFRSEGYSLSKFSRVNRFFKLHIYGENVKIANFR